ncbi:pyruvate kinase [Malaciobacter halophilus]|uniref:Pyruvate kinase n=1 Tax=Malaciobacter halophilus TaxID=197482 RepID=A0A2N1J4C6_9BACT|nr:pyruvate kinase [Malaciobacter halophilus]AXH10891.1 pyruvate kinase [Malaciobacter halophilus]PKI81396.1 pyruvate kinase [Malaciobacter halophilus]
MKKIIATVGPSLLYKTPINKIHNQSYIYRINGAHGTIQEIESHIKEIRKQQSDAKILMDLPGNKIRTTNVEDYIKIEEGENFTLNFNQLNYSTFFKHIKVGDIIWANDSIFKFKLLKKDLEKAQFTFLSYSTGKLQNNKGMHVRGIHEEIPFLFEKDKKLINLANKYHLDYIGLSFVRNKKDIQLAKELIENSTIISKVETLSAVNNLDEILEEVEHILIDRGDLSTEVGLNNIPTYQKFIIDKATFYNKKVFLATQFLKTMEINPIPTIAETIDLYNSLKSGIYGLQLSEETAIGNYPELCLDVINKQIKNIKEEYIR